MKYFTGFSSLPLLACLCLGLHSCQSARREVEPPYVVAWNQDNCFVPLMVHARDWRQLFFLEESTLARANVYERYIMNHISTDVQSEAVLSSLRVAPALDNLVIISAIIKNHLSAHPEDDQAWDLLEFYMCYQSKEYPYFSQIYSILEQEDLLSHPRAALMHAYKDRVEEQFINLPLYREIRARHMAQGVRGQKFKFGIQELDGLPSEEKQKLASFIIHAHDWRQLSIEGLQPPELALAQFYEYFLQAALRDHNAQWEKMLSLVAQRYESYTFPHLAVFVIEEWLSLHPDDLDAWDFVDFIFPLGDGEVMYTGLLFEALENQHLLVTKEGAFYMNYELAFTPPQENALPYDQLWRDLRKRAQRSCLEKDKL